MEPLLLLRTAISQGWSCDDTEVDPQYFIVNPPKKPPQHLEELEQCTRDGKQCLSDQSESGYGSQDLFDRSMGDTRQRGSRSLSPSSTNNKRKDGSRSVSPSNLFNKGAYE